ncbi:hypothetical protein GON01_08680 [Sphingomonas sp. MAH-20]|uniref:Capsule polysaccharide biosynthesis protein n=1 Tax=Sphingomonas horti TaxID=2682842 RepID=A0A6I4J0U5_9SPHN|nr:MULTISPECIES: hypothetical protein [Sphingomonas]MBA2919766.1 hypothetical protein [Sphingomonas sp. CGMCC 1.13658]MVO78007.1 hypothetical protein [Sphingomonas horti]
MKLPKVVFFARGYQADYFPTLASNRYEAVFVTLTRAEKRIVERRGHKVVACFECDFDRLPEEELPEAYLRTSFMADRFLGRFDAPMRRHILAKERAFWSRILDEHRPAAVVNELVAIEISEVLLIEAEARGIRYLAGMNCVVNDLFYWLPDPLSLSGRFIPDSRPGDESRRAAEAYLEEVRQQDYKPFYVQNLSDRRALRPIAAAAAKFAYWRLKRLFGRRFSYETYSEEYAKKLSVFFKSFFVGYDRLEDIPDGIEAIFYPLHQEPEATLNYMSEFYSDQVSTIENILKCLTPDQVLVVKEHPVDKGSLLRRKFRLIRKNCSALYYLPAEVHGRQVLDRASRVVTLTSTVGWEAAVTGHPVYVMGQIFYDNVPGITRIANFADLKAALRLPLSDQSRASLESVGDLVARMVEASYRGNPFPHAGLYSEDNRKAVVHAIASAAGA